MLQKLDIIVPVMNERENVRQFYFAISETLSNLECDYQVIFVDDGSTDGTWEEIRQLEESKNSVVGVRHRFNEGKDRAIESGMRHSDGDFILTIDGDFQHPIELIPKFWSKRYECEVIVGLQASRTQKGLRKRLSETFYKVIQYITGLDIPESTGDFRLITKEVKELLLKIADPFVVYRFALIKLRVDTQYIAFDALPRKYGSTKYSIAKLASLATDSVLSVTTRPLRLVGSFAIAASFLCFIEILFVVINKFIGNPISGWTSIVLILSFCFMGIFIALTIIGFYLAKIYEILIGYPTSMPK